MSTTYPIRNKDLLEKFKDYYYQKNQMKNYALIIVGLNTALRIGDILSLQWKDVYRFPGKDFRRHIHITEQKTGKESMIAMNTFIINALKLVITQNPENFAPEHYIFTSQKSGSRAMCRSQAYRIIKKAAAYADIEEHISCHSLRKTFGYYAWKQGTPPAMLMNIFNHSSFQITKRYLCIEQDDRNDVFLKIKI